MHFPQATVTGSLLHVRGGVSLNGVASQITAASSPRPWRCFPSRRSRERLTTVFSTSVEVFPWPKSARSCACRLLHVRGGVSQAFPYIGGLVGSSPRPWRCFYKQANRYLYLAESSPRPWRCFENERRTSPSHDVFSTSVEVFLMIACTTRLHSRLLHVRGGVSNHETSQSADNQSSPRPWRCFLPTLFSRELHKVFSTSVEVFLPSITCTVFVLSLLHVRGGVSELDIGCFFRARSSPRPWRCF